MTSSQSVAMTGAATEVKNILRQEELAMASTEELKHTQIEETLKDLFDYLITKNPLTNENAVRQLGKSLYEQQCLKTPINLELRNPLNNLSTIQTALQNYPKSRLIIKTWLEGKRSNYIPKLDFKEEVEGIKVLISTVGDPSEIDEAEATIWLKKLFKKPMPVVDKKTSSIFVSIYEASRNEAIPFIANLKTWREIKEKLKEFMIKNKDLPHKKILTECGILTVPSWKDYVQSDEIFNTHAPVCLPYLARMLRANIRVLKYPNREEVNFYFVESGGVTIELCQNMSKFAPLVPIDSDDDKLKQGRTLKDKIRKLKEKILELEEEIKYLKSQKEIDKNNIAELETSLKEAKQELKETVEKLQKAEDDKKRAMLKVARDVALKLFDDFKPNEGDDEDSSDFQNFVV